MLKDSNRIPVIPHHRIIGNAVEILKNPLSFLLTASRFEGDIVKYMAFQESLYFVNSPEGIRRILVENSRNYSIDNRTRRLMGVIMGNGLFVSEGDLWLHQRRLMQPLFHQKYINVLGEAMVESASHMCERWKSSTREGAYVVNIVEEMTQLTVDIAVTTLFGVYIQPDDAKEIRKALTTLFNILSRWVRSSLVLFLPANAVKLLPVYRQAIGVLDRIVYSIISKRKQSKDNAESDILGLLLSAQQNPNEVMSDTQLRDEVMTLLIAGHETSATALSWLFHALGQNASIYSKVKEEIVTVLGNRLPQSSDLAQLSYSRMVILETLRLYPPVWITFRRTLTDDLVEGYKLPAGKEVTISPYAMHRHPTYWQYPDTFHPEHFSSESESKRPAFAFIPFGAGPRQCIGRHFAITEMMLVLATLFQHGDVRLLPKQAVTKEALLTMRPKHPIIMSFSPDLERTIGY